MASEALNYMSVPEKIELTNSGPTGTAGGYPDSSDRTYRPMKIPDTITLGTADPTPLGGGVARELGGLAEGEMRTKEDVRQYQPPPHPEDVVRENMLPNTSSERFEAPSSTVPAANVSELEQRVRTLETKVQRLTETFLNSQRNEPPHREQKYGFWYVMTFAGWMMVPLIVVFMYQLRK